MAPTKSAAEKQKVKAEKERIRRKNIRDDPIKKEAQREKERIRYAKKKANNLRKSIVDMTPREKRTQRKLWRGYARTYNNKKKEEQKLLSNTNEVIESNAPPGSDDEIVSVDPLREVNIIQNKSNNLIVKLRRRINNDRVTIKGLKKKIGTQRKQLSRAKINLKKKERETNTRSPNKIVQNICLEHPLTSSPHIVKRLLFTEVIKQQLKFSYGSLTKQNSKLFLQKIVCGKIVKKYKMQKYCRKDIMRNRIISLNRKKKEDTGIKRLIQKFLEEDINSRMCSGKKDFVTRLKVTKQKRFLSDSLKNLHANFVKKYNCNISYNFFCLNRPFWIKEMKVTDRETCKCMRHANMELLINCLHKYNIINDNSIKNITNKFCCTIKTDSCMERTCPNCINSSIVYNDHISMNVEYFQWANTKEKYLDKKLNKFKVTNKMSKKKITKPIEDIIAEFKSNIILLIQHEGRIWHQYVQIDRLKKNLKHNETLIHMDFSENYCLKYAEETQSFHFGGSRQQITLHTSVAYSKIAESVITKSFCSLSESLLHNPAAIWCHLHPIIELILQNNNIDTFHFLSDGPSTQYRNKTMFYILGVHFKKYYPQIKKLTWNYLEAGHGKGAADGVGAVLKRTADRTVAQGMDISDFKTLVQVLADNCSGVNIFTVTEEQILAFSKKIDVTQTKLFAGTMKVHQISSHPNFKMLSVRYLSCFDCPQACAHYELGSLHYNKTALSDESNASSEDDSEDNMCLRSLQQKERLTYHNVYSSDEELTL